MARPAPPGAPTAFHAQPAALRAPSLRIAQLPVYALVLASTIWALYNAALAMVFSFGPALLKDQGWTLAAAGSVISAFMVVFSIAVPLGGILADKTGRANAIIIVSLAAFAVLMPLVPVLPPFAVAGVFLIVGGLFALAAGPIMTLPSSILPPASRTFGMGVFFSIYYVVMMVAPRVAGQLADWTGNAGIALIAGAGMAAFCILVLFLFGKARRKLAPA